MEHGVLVNERSRNREFLYSLSHGGFWRVLTHTLGGVLTDPLILKKSFDNNNMTKSPNQSGV